MSQTKKSAPQQFGQLSAQSEIHEASMEVSQNAIDTSYKKQKYLTEQNLETTNLINKSPSNNFQSFCMILIIAILTIVMISFALIAIGCLTQKNSQQQNIQVEETKKSIDNGTQLSKPTEQNLVEISNKNKQISALNIKVADLEFEVKKLLTELENEKKKSKDIQNGTYMPTNNTTPVNPQPPVNANTTTQNKTQPTKPSNQTQHQNQTTPSTPTNQTKPTKNQNNPNQQQKPKFTVRSGPRNGVPPGDNPNDRYQFSISIDQVVAKSPISYTYTTEGSQWSNIKKPEYQRAIRLMEVVHNVNIKGEFVLDHYKFYKTPEDKYNALSKIINEQRQFYDKKYQTSKYIHDQIGICVYLPSFNNAKNRLYLRNLDSVFQQEYQNYHVVYVNDASTDGTGEYVKSYMEENGIPKEKYVIINNEKNKGNCANIYMAAHQYCNQGEIMVLLDGDDVLIGRQVFSLLNAVYQKEKIALTYGQFLLVRNNQITSGFSREIPYGYLKDGNFRQLRGFFSSHLKTMYVDVMRAIKESDLQYANGTYYNYASDVAYMTPAIELVGTRLKFLKELNYEYRFDTGANEPHQQQIVVEFQVYDKPASKKMESMPFADNPKTVHYP